ncbi:MAG: protein kinase [Candidatus Obscuribacterales bacterium]
MAQLDDNEKTIVSAQAQSSNPTVVAARHCPKCGLAVADSTTNCPQDGTQIFETQAGILATKYDFITVTGSGGMSVVYKARRRDSGEIVAIKMLHSLLMNEQAMKRFQQEAKAITSLRHPNIINVHDFGVSEHGQPYMVMDFIEGNTLADVIKEKGGLTLEESLHRFIQLCDALEHAHEVGVLHRDLKPSNIMLSNRDGNFADARIVDFGIAKLLDKEDEQTDSGHLTKTGELFGSPLYMSPEQCRGSHVDARSDIYSMGCVMFETLTGQPPLKGASMVETFVLQMTEIPQPMSKVCVNRSFPDELEAVIAKTLAKDPEDRFQSMTELEYALMQIQPNQSSSKQSSRTKVKLQAPVIPKTILVGAVSAVSGFILASIIVSAMLSHHEKLQNGADSATGTQSGGQEVSQQGAPKGAEQQKIDIADYAKRNRKVKRTLEHGDEDLAAALRGDDLGLSRVDLSEARTPITDQSGVLLGNLKSLTDLDLDENRIGDRTLAAVQNLPITKLSLRRTLVTDLGIFELCHHAINKRLESLAITGCSRITDESVASIGEHLQALKSLAISSLPFTDKGFSKLSNLHLLHLFADDTAVTDAGLAALSNMTSLKELQLNYTKTADAGISHLAKLDELETLGLAGTVVTDKATSDLAKLRNLKALDLGYTLITGHGLKNLAPLQNLTKLGLYNTRLKDEDLKVLSNFPRLESLNLANTNITDDGVNELVKLKSLRTLDIGGSRVTNKGVKKLAALPNLQKVILYDLAIDLESVRKLRDKKPELQIKLIAPLEKEEGFYDDPRNFHQFPNS